jgi:hypothetical protein
MSTIKTDTIESVTTNGALTLTPNGSGGLVTDHWTWPLVDGAANQILETDGSGNLDWVAAGGGWSYVSTATASNSATLDFTNMASGYDYKYMVDYMIMAADNKYLDMRVGVAGPTYRTSGYLGVVRNSAGTTNTSNTGVIRIVGASAGIGNAANENLWGAEVILMNPASATYKTTAMGRAGFGDTGGTPITNYTAGNYTTAEANTCARFFAHVGNISSGTILQYRRSRT